MAHVATESIIVFTDGASRGNPGPGGFAAIVIMPQTNQQPPTNNQRQVIELGGRDERTTNNRMELTAAIEALLQIKDLRLKITVYSDSSYLINGITKWVHGWQKHNWKTAAKKDVENRDLWEELLNLTIYRHIEWKYVRGHVGIAGNHRADEIATAFADSKKVQLYSGPIEKYPIKDILDIKEDVSLASKRESNKTRSRAEAYSYVSKVDGAVQTHKTWKECEARVKEKSSAKYQKVFSAEAERSLVRTWGRMK